MSSSPRRYSLVVGLCCALFALSVCAQQVRRDVDYRLLPRAQEVTAGERIEVIDFFFYACPYCYDLLPHIEAWRKRMPADVVFKRVPVVGHDSWAPLAKIYYTLEAMGADERLHVSVYRAYHVDRLSIDRETVIVDWADKNGLDRDKFVEIYRSDDIRLKAERARAMTKDYDIRATPTVVVDGKYLTSGGMSSSLPQVINVVDGLVKLARDQRAQAAGK